MDVDVRMEQVSLQIGSAVIEKLGVPSTAFLKDYLFSIFKSLHFYKNTTKAKIIPLPVMKSVWTFFANVLIYQSS
jgi:hypothetical protein